MARLKPVSLNNLITAIWSEYIQNKSIFAYPLKKFFLGFSKVDLGIDFGGRRIATPLGPASGPHTQLAPNIIKSFLGGARFFELKSVQILDQLKMSSPTIDVPNVGFNIEWSQELSLYESLHEYVKAWIILKAMEEDELLDIPKGDPFYDYIFDVSVGYDLKGIKSSKVTKWLNSIINAKKIVQQELSSISSPFKRFSSLEVDPKIATSVTISTFHGCPSSEIESIVRYILSTFRIPVIIKLNPMILGFEQVEDIINNKLGFNNIEIDPQDFEKELTIVETTDMLERLQTYASDLGLYVGVKCTNTLVVNNNRQVFSDKKMYLSGKPLYVIAMNIISQLRERLGEGLEVSFSAGIDKRNFVDTLSLNIKPITICTDLLKPGGYTRLVGCLDNLKKDMLLNSAKTIDQYIKVKAKDQSAKKVIDELVLDNRYHYTNNRKTPRKTNNRLDTFDCVPCNNCITVCPNNANFKLSIDAQKVDIINYRVKKTRLVPVKGEVFNFDQKWQIGNLPDLCNECGNCETFCPEDGGPFRLKPRFFSHQEYWQKDTQKSDLSTYSFYYDGPNKLIGRIKGEVHQLSYSPDDQTYCYETSKVKLIFNLEHKLVKKKIIDDKIKETKEIKEDLLIEMLPYYQMRSIMQCFENDQKFYPSIFIRSGKNY